MLKCDGYVIEQKTHDVMYILTEHCGIRYYKMITPRDIGGKRLPEGVDPLIDLCESITKRVKEKIEHHMGMCTYFNTIPISGDFYESAESRYGDKLYFGIMLSIIDHFDLWKTVDKSTTTEQYMEYTYNTKRQKEMFIFGE